MSTQETITALHDYSFIDEDLQNRERISQAEMSSAVIGALALQPDGLLEESITIAIDTDARIANPSSGVSMLVSEALQSKNAQVTDLNNYRRNRDRYKCSSEGPLDSRFVAPSMGLTNHELLKSMVEATTNKQRVTKLINLTSECTEAVVQPNIIPDENLARKVVLLHRCIQALRQLEEPRELVKLEQNFDFILGKFIKGYGPYIHKEVSSLSNDSISLTIQDLVSAGSIGFLQAMGSFDLGQTDVKVFSYCRRRVRGAAVDEIRSFGAVIRPARWISVVWRKDILPKLQANVPVDAIAQEIGVSRQYIYEIQTLMNHTITVPLESIDHDADTRIDAKKTDRHDFIADDINVEQLAIDNLHAKSEVDHALETLSNKEQRVVCMYFGYPPYPSEGYKMKEIGIEMGVTEASISYLLKAVRQKLRAKLSGNPV
jgi:RNA polymerase sigma factor (sigma-70 family)